MGADGKSERGQDMGITVNVGEMPVFLRNRAGGLKSAEKKLERMQSRDDQLAVLEKQKANLKNRECSSLDEIEDKLNLLHSYKDQIRAVKHAFNMEEISHILDEAREKGEKIAEEIKKLLPETEEEREDVLPEDAMGGEKEDGMLSELLGEMDRELPDAEPGLDTVEEMAEATVEMDVSEEMRTAAVEAKISGKSEGSAEEMEELKELADRAAEESAERAKRERTKQTKKLIS